MKLIFIIKIRILVNTCTFSVTHPGISKQLGLKPCTIELQKHVLIRNYYIIYGMNYQTMLVSHHYVAGNEIKPYLQVIIELKRMTFLRTFSVFPTLEK